MSKQDDSIWGAGYSNGWADAKNEEWMWITTLYHYIDEIGVSTDGGENGVEVKQKLKAHIEKLNNELNEARGSQND